MKIAHILQMIGLFLFSVAACSEGPLDQDDLAATQFVHQVSAKFKVVQPLLERSRTIERDIDGFRPDVPVQLKRFAPGYWRKSGSHKLDVEWPDKANGVMRLSSGPVTIEVRPVGTRAVAGEMTERALVYRDAYQSASSFHVAEADRVEEFILLRDEKAPRSFEWEVKVMRGRGSIRQYAGVIEALDEKGVAWLRMEHPYIVDNAEKKTDVEVQLEDGKLAFIVPSSIDKYPALLDPGWTTTGSMLFARSSHTATLLSTGKVLVAGGYSDSLGYLDSAELYDPSTETWSVTGSLNVARDDHKAVRLASGKVLVSGGIYSTVQSAELYDPTAGTWAVTGDMMVAERDYHTATLLSSGKVLVAGGDWPFGTTSAELYDPGTETWTATGSMSVARIDHTATLLSSGKVLVAGGRDWMMEGIDSSEIYDPSAGTWTVTGSMGVGRNSHQAALLSSGKVLVAGGSSSTAELYDPSTGFWTNTGSMSHGGSSGTLLASNKFLMAGYSYSEEYDPSTGTWSQSGGLNESRYSFTMTLLPSTKVLAAGGQTAIAELYDPTLGLTCQSVSDCLSGYCVDGICCESACTETCKVCQVENGVGKCVYVAAGTPDSNASYPCIGTSACDGNGQCKKANGQSCTTANDCGSGICMDWRCCDTTCNETCKGCNVAGNEGTCSDLPAGETDSNASYPCTGSSACDGNGICKSAVGQPCSSGTDCAEALCIDGYCCETSCTETCKSCAVPGSLGVCSNIVAGVPDDNATVTCTETQACDGAGVCKKANGQSCSVATECGSGYCIDTVCCNSSCTDTCYSCDVPQAGVCSYTPAGQLDSNAMTPCIGANACDGNGICKKGNGQACSSGSECGSAYCVDGVCCNSVCSTTCYACNVVGKEGFCSLIPADLPDTLATGTCVGSNACDGNGACKLVSGQPCANDSECATDLCVDQTCCKTDCAQTCYSCAVPGSEGTCSPLSDAQDTGCDGVCGTCNNGLCTALPQGTEVTTGNQTCTGEWACDGNGACKKKVGQSCSAPSVCVSDLCVDGVCCSTACDATCYSCAVSGSEGTCSPLTDTSDSGCAGACETCMNGACTPLPQGTEVTTGNPTCSGNSACDGKGECKKKAGQGCIAPADCASDHCVDGYCCSTACDKTCEACSIPGSEGTCEHIAANTDPDGECIGTSPYCGGACDGAGQCEFPGIGTTCGLCKACDGTGRCNSMPPDDENCGVLDCDELDTECRDYEDIKTDRCESFGKCKESNFPATCKQFSELACGDAGVIADAGTGMDDAGAVDATTPGQEAGTERPSEDAGCSCHLGQDASKDASLPLFALLVLGLALVRRKRSL